MKDGDVILLQNTRFRPEEEKNVENFSEELGSLADLFVNDAFGTAHRAHCSTVGVTNYVKESANGYLMAKEVEFLGNAVENPVRPFVCILGGAKVADKLAGMCKTEKEEYEKYWEDISPFIKFGCLKDDKFCEKMNDYILFKDLDGKYMTLPECLETKPIDTEDEEDKDAAEDVSDSVEEAEAESEAEAEDKEKKDKIIYYVTDEQQQSQYINMFKQAKKNAVILTHNIDQPFVSQLESKNEGIKFMRIDADLTDEFLGKTSKKAREEMDAQATDLDKIFKKALKNEKITVKVEKLKNKKISSMITLSEETRRMQDMMKMYGMGGMNMPGMDGEGETLVLNAGHPLVKYILDNKEGDNTKLICEQLYDLAKLQHAPLSPEAMTRFIQRSNDIMCLVSEK
jgi:molecular chaperone HtpG